MKDQNNIPTIITNGVQKQKPTRKENIAVKAILTTSSTLPLPPPPCNSG
jgi:hypothetical protein